MPPADHVDTDDWDCPCDPDDLAEKVLTETGECDVCNREFPAQTTFYSAEEACGEEWDVCEFCYEGREIDDDLDDGLEIAEVAKRLAKIDQLLDENDLEKGEAAKPAPDPNEYYDKAQEAIAYESLTSVENKPGIRNGIAYIDGPPWFCPVVACGVDCGCEKYLRSHMNNHHQLAMVRVSKNAYEKFSVAPTAPRRYDKQGNPMPRCGYSTLDTTQADRLDQHNKKYVGFRADGTLPRGMTEVRESGAPDDPWALCRGKGAKAPAETNDITGMETAAGGRVYYHGKYHKPTGKHRTQFHPNRRIKFKKKNPQVAAAIDRVRKEQFEEARKGELATGKDHTKYLRSGRLSEEEYHTTLAFSSTNASGTGFLRTGPKTTYEELERRKRNQERVEAQQTGRYLLNAFNH